MKEQLPVTTNYKPTKKEKEKKTQEAIKLLNLLVRFKLAPSPIHGIGVFALKDLKKGEKLNLDAIPHAFDVPYKQFKKLDKGIEEILLGHWPQIINGSHFLYPVTKMTAYLNHSDDANYDCANDVVIKDIKAGEELTEDYRKIEGYEKVFPWLKIAGEKK